MRYEDAKRAVTERSQVCNGEKPDADAAHGRFLVEEASPEELCRLLLSGLVEFEDMDAVLDGTRSAATNTAVILMGAETIDSFVASMMVFLSQRLAMGILMGQDS